MSVLDEYTGRTPASRKHFEAVERLVPAGATRSLNAWPPYPVYLESGAGGMVWDVDGNAYREFLYNYTALPLGYADPDVMAVLGEELSRGTAYSFSRTLEKELADLLVSRIPSIDKVRFTGSGTEAVMFALRLARAYTGRSAIAKAEGGYHGTIDDVMVSVRPPLDKAGPPDAPAAVPEMRGISPSALEHTIVVPFNDVDGTTAILRRDAERLAALILEPVLGVGGMIPATLEYLRAVRQLCDELGILLIYDEVITLRLAVGGAQERYGVRPDLTAMGKIVGGGMPIGAYGGRAEVMALLEPQGGTDVYDARAGGPPLYQGGTFTGNPLSLIAGITTLTKLDAAAIEHLDHLGQSLCEALAAAFETSPIASCVTGTGSLFNLHVGVCGVRNFRDTRRVDGALQHRFFLSLLNRGFVVAPRGMGCVSTCTTHEDVGAFVTSVREAIDDIADRAKDDIAESG